MYKRLVFFNPIRDLFLACVFLLQPAVAQNFSTSIEKIQPAETKSSVQPKLSLELKSLNYAAGSVADDASQGQVELMLGLKKQGFLFADLELTVGSFSGSRSVYIPVPDAYLAVGSLKSNYLALGIKTQSFSFVDRYYHLGLYESYFTNDFIDYKEQGFAGIQLQVHQGYFGFKGGFQPVFLKNQGPEIHEQDGSIVSSNRWAKRPPKRFEFVQGQDKRIEYVIRAYDVEKIITNQGHTLSLFVGENVERPWLQVSYARHPLNEIPLTRETYGTINDFTGHVFLAPVVTYHEVKSADINLDGRLLKSTFSYLEDQPFNNEPFMDETLQVLNPLKVYAVYFALDLKDYISRNFLISLAAAEMRGGEIKDKMQGGKVSIFTFSANRTIFKSPVTLGFTGDSIFFGERPLITTVSWTYDREFKGSLLSAKLMHETWKKLYLQAGLDLLGTENELPADAPENFLSQNQANDRFYAGVKYVF
ncbi:MAG: hypothetical protein H7328_11280 [Bdellovibrio sp.]|nr:hypothetical protein [Bdellovibrio sp.]